MSSDSSEWRSVIRVCMGLFVLSVVLAVPFAGSAAAQNAHVSSTVSIQVMSAAGFDIDDDHDEDRNHHGHRKHGGGHHINIRSNLDDTVASIVTRDNRGERRTVTLLSRGRATPISYESGIHAPTFIQIMY